jgi:hypothetical protein
MTSLRDFIERLLSFLPGAGKKQEEVAQPAIEKKPELVETQPPVETATKPAEGQAEEKADVAEPEPPGGEPPRSPEPPKAEEE